MSAGLFIVGRIKGVSRPALVVTYQQWMERALSFRCRS